MRIVKRYIMLSVLLLVYLAAITVLLRSYYIYQDAYQILGRLISHSSVELTYELEE